MYESSNLIINRFFFNWFWKCFTARNFKHNIKLHQPFKNDSHCGFQDNLQYLLSLYTPTS